MIRLERSLVGRLVGGSRLQPMVALLVVLVAVRAVGQAAGAIGDKSLPIGATLLVLLALVAVLVAGATGHAEADDAGVRWRYYLPHTLAWGEIDEIVLRVVGVSIAGVRHQIVLRTHRGRHEITPAGGAGPGRVRFGRDLLAAASARGIEVRDEWR